MKSVRSIPILVMASAAIAQTGSTKAMHEDLRRVPNHVTEGWIVSYGNPDPQRTWERIPGTIVIARHGKVIRRITVDGEVRSWGFWRMGAEVGIEAAGLHGPSECFLVSVKTGKRVAEVPGSCDLEDPAAPAWMKVMGRLGSKSASLPPR